MSYKLQMLETDDGSLALHGWIPPNPKAMVFYVHGTQSHAGWLYDSGPILASKGVALYSLDRRGAGQSAGQRGHVDNFTDWIEDYLQAADYVRELHPQCPMTALGQSFGGAILAALAKSGKLKCEALAFCAPALNQYRRNYVAPKTAPPVGQYGPVRLLDEWYTTDPKYLSFLKDDKLMLREITAGTVIQRLALEEFYLDTAKPWPQVPTVLVMPKVDRIIDIAIVRKTMEELCGGRLTHVEFPSLDHYLEFSPCRDSYLSFLSSYALTQGFAK